MTKPSRSFPRPLSELVGATLSDGLKQQGFASTELITRWADIVGTEVAAHSDGRTKLELVARRQRRKSGR